MATVLPVIAQQSGFIHLQSENNLPYQAQWDGNTFASSANGYLVIPQVKAGEHTLLISFAPEISAPYAFTLVIGDKPRGFSIRQAVDNTWRLFDLIDYSLVAGKPVPKENKTILAEEPVVQPSQQPAIAVKTKDSTPVISKAPPVVKVPRPSVEIKKIFDKESASGIDQVYVITKANRSDTIALFIPVLNEHMPAQLAGLYLPGVETVVFVPANKTMINSRNRNLPSSK